MPGSREENYANGKRVFRGASHTPKPGRKNPAGYVKRELAKKKPDQRSGKAAAFLRAKDSYKQQQNPERQLKEPMIPHALTPVGLTGIMKDHTGRLYYGNSPQAQEPAQGPAI